MMKTKLMVNIEERFGQKIEVLLEEFYYNQRKNGKEIANQLSIKEPTVYKYLRVFGIRCRSPSEYLRGKSPSDETRKKMSMIMKGRKIIWGKKISKSKKGKKFSLQHRENISKSQKGRSAWNKGKVGFQKSNKKGKTYEEIYGIERAKEIRIRMKIAAREPRNREQRRLRGKRLWQDPAFVQKNLRSLFQKPNRSEQRLIEIINHHKLPFKYVGQGEISVDGRVPDFISPDSKKIIELFGRPWHDPNNVYHSAKIDYYRTMEGRINFFREHDYDCLIIWTDELKDKNHIVDRINAFMAKKDVELYESVCAVKPNLSELALYPRTKSA